MVRRIDGVAREGADRSAEGESRRTILVACYVKN